MCIPNVIACLRELTEVVTPQLDAVIIEESSGIALSLRGIIHGDYTGPNICHHKMGPMVTRDFTVAKLPILA